MEERKTVNCIYTRQEELTKLLQEKEELEAKIKECRKYKICNCCGKEYVSEQTSKYCSDECKIKKTM